jgi:hypothetical protein
MKRISRLLLVAGAALLGAAALVQVNSAPSAQVIEILSPAGPAKVVRVGRPLFFAIHAAGPNGVTSIELLLDGRRVAERAVSGAPSLNTVLRWQPTQTAISSSSPRLPTAPASAGAVRRSSWPCAAPPGRSAR